MSFTVTIKEEVSKLKSTRSETIAELSAYIRNNGTITNNKITLTTENHFIVERVVDEIKELFDFKPTEEVIENLNFSKKELYQITIDKNLDLVEKELGILDEKGIYYDVVPEYIVGGEEEIKAYLKGAFLASGSINDPKKSRYHMEILATLPEEAVYVQKLLNNFELNAKILNREKGYMIYIKEAEKISDFMKLIGATNAVLYYENVRIYRDQKNMTNRLNNCEQANMDKVFETASEQLKQIEIIEKNDGVMLLDDRTKVALEYRKKYPEVSLKELAEIISIETGKTLTKSGINHRMRKIKELATRFEKRETTNE
ncbi:MAG: DNA-binding protein WhiA [Bacilli bacterium]|nr:DNA-binding protein WhiA [Bacilli bacterium]